MRCEAELCGNWTGHGCACEVMGLKPDVSLSCDLNDHPDEGDGVCACGLVVYRDPEDDDDE